MQSRSPIALRASPTAAFSLPEIAMAIAITAITFVSLLALIPFALETYRSAIDESNETWILQGVNAMVQTTDFSKIEHEIDYTKRGEIFFFDEEGLRLQTAAAAPESQAAYAAKLFVAPLRQPGSKVAAMAHGFRILAVLAPAQNPSAMEEFHRIAAGRDLDTVPRKSPLRVRSFVVSRQDSEPQK